VLVRVRATGVCRSDWHAWKGHDPVSLPHVPGHELAGVVEVVGPDVHEWRASDRVTVPFVCGCGRCDYCRAGEAQVCPHQTQPGFTGPGSFAELVAIHAADTNLVRLPDDVDFVTAASLGCRFATAYRALTAHGRVRSGDWLAVHGCGGVGLSAVMVGAALGARVVAVDVRTEALERARDLGAELLVDARDVDDAGEAVHALTGGGAHVSLDALGSAGTAEASVRSLRRRGRHVQVGLLLGRDSTPPLPMDRVVAQELEIYGSHGMAASDYPGMLALVADGTLRPDRLVGEVIGLERAGEALAAMDLPATVAGLTVVAIPD
jgi:alcohol dehydrogenase